MYKSQHISVVIPALNEEDSILQVISGLMALKDSEQNPIIDDIVVCDNGSTDHTAFVADYAGARVVSEPIPGYGRACLKAIEALDETDIVLFIDADHAFYGHQAIGLISAVASGADLAIGSRTLGHIEDGALTLPQTFGNHLASFLIRAIWHHPVTDLGPFRAIRYTVLKQLNMADQTFGWTIEMQIKAIQCGMNITEVAVDTKRRIGVSKISGTIKGSIGAGIGILGMIYKCWREESKRTLVTKNPLTKGGSL